MQSDLNLAPIFVSVTLTWSQNSCRGRGRRLEEPQRRQSLGSGDFGWRQSRRFGSGATAGAPWIFGQLT